MSNAMRMALVCLGLVGTLGCAFFEVADIDKPVPPKKVEAAAKAGAPGGAGMAASAGTGGTGGAGVGAGGQAGM